MHMGITYILEIWICSLLFIYASGHEFSQLSPSMIEPTENFAFQFRPNLRSQQRLKQNNDIFSTLKSQHRNREYHNKMLNDESIQFVTEVATHPRAIFGDVLHVRFTAYGELFDMELTINRHMTGAHTRLVMGEPGSEKVYRPHLVSYAADTVDSRGEQVRATFTVMHDRRLRGVVVRGTDVYQVAPMDHLETDLGLKGAPAAVPRGPTLQSDAHLASLRARAAASSDMVVYKMSELQLQAAASMFPSPPLAAAPAAAAGARPPAAVSRQPLLQRWTDCHSEASGLGVKVFIDYMVDFGAALHFSASLSTVSAAAVWTRMAEAQAFMNVYFHAQLGVAIAFALLQVKSALSTETSEWNRYAYDDDRSVSISIETQFTASLSARTELPASKGAAAMHVVTRAQADSTGRAVTGSLRNVADSSSVYNNALALTSVAADSTFPLSLTSQTAILFGATDVLVTCDSSYYQSGKGGIMDSSNDSGVLGLFSDSPGEVGFHSRCTKPEMCTVFSTKYEAADDTSTYAPRSNSFEVIVEEDAAECGNGLVEVGEECDIYGGDTACCVGCQLVSGATCALPGTCCVDCQMQPATTVCGINSFCGISGKCEESSCLTDAYCGGPSGARPCSEQCMYDGSTCTTSSNNLGIIPGRPCTFGTSGTSGVCTGSSISSMACVPLTYSWEYEPFPSCSCSADEVAHLTRVVQCIASNGQTVAGSYCEATESKPAVVQTCCDYSWSIASDWSTCSSAVDAQTRSVVCLNVDRDDAVVADSLCLEEKPADTNDCASQYRWACAVPSAAAEDMSDAATCTAADTTTGYVCVADTGVCGSATSTRLVACLREDVVVDDSECSAATTKPSSSKSCFVSCFDWRCAAESVSVFDSTASCSGTAGLDVGWGPCELACNSATQTRWTHCWNIQEQTMVSDASCEPEPEPVLERVCETDPVFSDLVVAPASPVAGANTSVSWCYYGPDSRALVVLKGEQRPYTTLSTTTLGAGSASFTLPVSGARTAQVAISTASGEIAQSSVLSIQSRCENYSPCSGNGACVSATGLCQCDEGYSGDNCSVSACDSCVAGHSTCFPTEGVCVCSSDWAGPTCAQAAACDQTSCRNGGFRSQTDGVCDSECTCTEYWADATCSTCALDCGAHGEPNAECSGCVCDRGYFGDDCGCRGAYGTLRFPMFPDDTDSFSAAIMAEVAVETGADPSQVSIVEFQASSEGTGVKAILGVSVCPASVSAHPSVQATLPALLSVSSFASMADVYAGWETIHATDASGQLLKNGDAVAMGGDVTVDAMYDPACEGDDCPTGENPFLTDSPEASGEKSSDIGIIAGAAAGGAIVIIGIFIVCWCCCYKRSGDDLENDDIELFVLDGAKVAVLRKSGWVDEDLLPRFRGADQANETIDEPDTDSPVADVSRNASVAINSSLTAW